MNRYKFPDKLVNEFLDNDPDGDTRRLVNPFTWRSPRGDIVVPAGFEHDFASVPRIVWNIYPPDGKYAPAAVIHDFLYVEKNVNGEPITRSEADELFSIAMEDCGVGWFSRGIIWAAVRVGGWTCWGDAEPIGPESA